MADITWTNVRVKLGELKPWERNPRRITKDQAERLLSSWEAFGQVELIAIGPENDVYNGHQRLNVLLAAFGSGYEVEARRSSRHLSEKEREKLTVFLHQGTTGEWDFDVLANEFEFEDLLAWGFKEQQLTGVTYEPILDPDIEVKRYTEEDLDKRAKEMAEAYAKERKLWPVKCPKCGTEFHVDRE